MSVNTLLGIFSAICFAVPIIIILYGRLFNISLLSYLTYFSLCIVCNLIDEQFITANKSFERMLAVLTNYLDVPLMLLGMLLFCTEKWKQKMIKITLLLFMIYELIIFTNFKMLPVSSKYVLGPGIILVLLFSFYLFINHIRSTIMLGKGIGKTLMISSVLFAYGSYLLVYIFAFIQKTSNRADVYTIYYITSIIFALIMSAGLIWIKKRVKDINEVQQTRKELGLFFNH
jgi:hypothetical protein